MIDRILDRLKRVELRGNRIDVALRALVQWQRWVEQRLRELNGGASYASASVSPDFDGIADRLHATAKVTTAITKSTGPGSPGVGAVQRYVDFAAGSDLTGVDEPIYSIWTDYGVTTDATVQMEWKQKAWWLIDVDTCDHMV